jgi:hypothetical protein
MPKYAPGQTVRSKAHGIVHVLDVKKGSPLDDLIVYEVELKNGGTKTIAGMNLLEEVDDPSFAQRREAARLVLGQVHDDVWIQIAEMASEVTKISGKALALDPATLTALSSVNRYFRGLLAEHRQKLVFGAGIQAQREWRVKTFPLPQNSAEQVVATCAKLAKDDLLAFRRVGEYILETYPPTDYVYLGVGGSPTPVTAYLRACPGTRVVDVPVSALNSYRDTYREVWDENQDKIVHFLDKFLLGVIERDTQLLAIDYSSGNSLWVIEYLLRKYLQHRFVDLTELQARERVLPLSINTYINSGPADLDSRAIRIVLDKDPLFEALVDMMTNAVFKDLAYRIYPKHSLFDVMNGEEVPEPTLVEYQDLCAQIRGFLKTYREEQEVKEALSGAVMGK